MISQRLLTPLKLIRGLLEFVSLVSYVVVTKRLPIIFHALEFSCEKKEMDDRAEEEDETLRSWLVRPCWQTNKKGKSILEKNRVKFFDEIISIWIAVGAITARVLRLCAPARAQHDAGESFFFFFSRKLFCLSNRVNAPWAHLTPGGSPKEKKRK